MSSQKYSDVVEKIYLPLLDCTDLAQNYLKEIKDALKLIMDSLNLANDQHFVWFHDFMNYLTTLWQYKIEFHKLFIQNGLSIQFNCHGFNLEWIISFLESYFIDTPYAGHIRSLFLLRIYMPIEINKGNEGTDEINAGLNAADSIKVEEYVKGRLHQIDPFDSTVAKPPLFLRALLDLIISPMNTCHPGHIERIKQLFNSIKFNLDHDKMEKLLFRDLVLAYFDCQLAVARKTNKQGLEVDLEYLLETIVNLISEKYSEDSNMVRTKLDEIKAVIAQNKEKNDERMAQHDKESKGKTDSLFTCFEVKHK